MKEGCIRIGQAVVSDGGKATEGGYALLAASPSVEARERVALDRSPGASDFLHREAAPGSFWSFFPLPSGRWALTHRFVSGKRRGAFNRVVTHTLVVAGEALASFDDQPWLLLLRAGFRGAGSGGKPQDLAGMMEVAGDPSLRELPDLEAALTGDVREASLGLILGWRQTLEERWGREVLTTRLGEVLAALEGGRRVLLPQRPGYDELLALAWSLLPPRDRLAAPWTTHFAPGVEALFRMAVAVDVVAARNAHRDTAEWVSLGGRIAGAGPRAGSAADLLVETALASDKRLEAALDGWRRHDFRVMDGCGPGAARWLGWLREGPRLLEEGLASAEALAAYLSERPWLEPDDRLRLAGSSALGLYRRGQPFEAAVESAAAALGRAEQPALNPGEAWVVWLDGGLDADRWERGVATLAVKVQQLAGGAAGTPGVGQGGEGHGGDESRLAAAQALGQIAPPPGADTRPAMELRRTLLLGLARRGSREAVQMLGCLAEEPAELELLVARLGSEPVDGVLAAGLVTSAARVAAGSAAMQEVIARCILAAFERMPATFERLTSATVAVVMQGMRQDRSLLVAALQKWRGRPYERAVLELEDWFSRGDEAAAEVAAAVAASARPTAGIEPTPAMGRLSLRVLEAGRLPADVWMPFALAGARALDLARAAECPRFAELVDRRQLEPGQALAWAGAVLENWDGAPVGSEDQGLCQGALVELLRKGAGDDAATALELEAQVLGMAVLRGRASLRAACERLDDLASKQGPADPLAAAVGAMVSRGLSRLSAAEWLRSLIDLHCADDVQPTVRGAVGDVLTARMSEPLDIAAAEVLAELPDRPVEGGVLLAAGRQLGRFRGRAAALAARFVVRAFEAGRPDAASAALGAAFDGGTRKGAPFGGLEPGEKEALDEAIRCGAAAGGGWRLAPFVGRVHGRRRVWGGRR